jgi:isoamylase
MILAGDEFGNSQHGNNNAYCQDNDIGWLEWNKISDRDKELTEFVRKVIALRAAHPIFRRDTLGVRVIHERWSELIYRKAAA